MAVDVRALDYKELRSLLLMIILNQKSLLEAMRCHAEVDHKNQASKEFTGRLRRLDERMERFLQELSHIAKLLEDKEAAEPE